jgi:hypothetical protein
MMDQTATHFEQTPLAASRKGDPDTRARFGVRRHDAALASRKAVRCLVQFFERCRRFHRCSQSGVMPPHSKSFPISTVFRGAAAALCGFRRCNHSSRAFSLLEILVAVGLLSVIILGLLSMFYQTEKAFRFGTRQVDVLESGRAVTELLVRELQEITSAHDTNVINLFASTNFAPVIQPRPGAPQYNYLQDYYFVTKRNDLWTGVAYFVEPVTNAAWPRPGGVGSLYRYTNSVPGMFPDALTNLYNNYQIAQSVFPKDWHRISDNIIHLRVIPYDRNGIIYTNLPSLLQYAFPYQIAPDAPLPEDRYEFMPAFVDLEVGILEPRALERYVSISDPGRAAQFLTNQADKVHLFRQRIPVRTSR